MSPLADRRVAWLLAVVHAALAARALADDRYLHDEGLLTRLFAELVVRDPWPAIFMQKLRPPVALLYASVGHVEWFFAMHVVVAAAAVVLIASAARHLGQRSPNVAAAVVALSPMFVAGSAAGVTNTDAVTGLCLVVWALARSRWVLAGLVMGVLVWVRSELAVLALAVLGLAVARRKPIAIAGLLAWPLAYGGAGALYHGDVAWMVRFPPALPASMPGHPLFSTDATGIGAAELVGTAIALTPLVGFAALVRLRDLGSIERWLGAATLVLGFALLVLPRWHVFNFDLSPRYLMPLLPMLALAIGRVADAGWHRGRGDTLVLVGLAALALWAQRDAGSAAGLWTVSGTALTITAAKLGRDRIARLFAAALLAAGPAVFAAGARLDRLSQSPHLEEVVARLHEHVQAGESRPIYTNEPLLAEYLRRSGGLPDARVFYIVQADQLHELEQLTNAENGQRTAIFAALEQGFYGTPVFPASLDPSRVPSDALFVLTGDPRLSQVMPDATWRNALRVLHPGRGAFVAELSGRQEAR